MNTKLTVGNLALSLNESDLEKLFGQFGKVISVTIPTDSKNGLNRGFAFIEMEDPSCAEEAINNLNGKNIEGRQLSVNS